MKRNKKKFTVLQMERGLVAQECAIGQLAPFLEGLSGGIEVDPESPLTLDRPTEENGWRVIVPKKELEARKTSGSGLNGGHGEAQSGSLSVHRTVLANARESLSQKKEAYRKAGYPMSSGALITDEIVLLFFSCAAKVPWLTRALRRSHSQDDEALKVQV